MGSQPLGTGWNKPFSTPPGRQQRITRHALGSAEALWPICRSFVPPSKTRLHARLRMIVPTTQRGPSTRMGALSGVTLMGALVAGHVVEPGWCTPTWPRGVMERTLSLFSVDLRHNCSSWTLELLYAPSFLCWTLSMPMFLIAGTPPDDCETRQNPHYLGRDMMNLLWGDDPVPSSAGGV